MNLPKLVYISKYQKFLSNCSTNFCPDTYYERMLLNCVSLILFQDRFPVLAYISVVKQILLHYILNRWNRVPLRSGACIILVSCSFIYETAIYQAVRHKYFGILWCFRKQDKNLTGLIIKSSSAFLRIRSPRHFHCKHLFGDPILIFDSIYFCRRKSVLQINDFSILVYYWLMATLYMKNILYWVQCFVKNF